VLDVKEENCIEKNKFERNFSPWINNIQIEHLMSSFQDFGLLFFFHNNPEAEAQRNYVHAVLNDKRERERIRVTSLGSAFGLF